jgi:hypothetical protein
MLKRFLLIGFIVFYFLCFLLFFLIYIKDTRCFFSENNKTYGVTSWWWDYHAPDQKQETLQPEELSNLKKKNPIIDSDAKSAEINREKQILVFSNLPITVFYKDWHPKCFSDFHGIYYIKAVNLKTNEKLMEHIDYFSNWAGCVDYFYDNISGGGRRTGKRGCFDPPVESFYYIFRKIGINMPINRY